MSNLKLISLSVAAVLALSFSGCGSDDAGEESGGDAKSGIETVESNLEKVEFSECGPSTNTHDGDTSIEEFAANGKFTVECGNDGGYIKFADNINELIITQITSREVGKGKDTSDTYSYVQTKNLSTGTLTVDATSTYYGTFKCTEVYNLDGLRSKTINDGSEVTDLLKWYEGFNIISSDCPWANEDDDDDNDEGDSSHESVKTILVTDSEGTVSTIVISEKETRTDSSSSSSSEPEPTSSTSEQSVIVSPANG